MRGLLCTTAATVALLDTFPAPGRAAFIDQPAVAAQPHVIAPFGYGTVTQVFATSTGRTGAAWCKAQVNRLSQCLSVSGGASCSALTEAGTLVSCNQTGKAHVDETRFAPVDCHNQMQGDTGASGIVTDMDWCGWAGYMARRTADTVYQYNDYVRLGVNRRFGGTVFELYGTDKLDRIQQNPGGAMQMALYGDDIGYAPPSTPHGWFAFNPSQTFLPPNATGWDNTPYPSAAACKAAHPADNEPCREELAIDNVSDDVHEVGCANAGQDAGAGFNPVQSVSLNCWYGDANNYVDTTTSPAKGFVAVRKTAPNNYSKSTNVPGLTWTQTSQVVGPFAQLTYDIVGDSTLRPMFQDFQELPAIFTHGAIGSQVFFYSGTNPYKSLAEPVTHKSVAQGTYGVIGFPTRSQPYGTSYDAGMTEDWASMCDDAGKQCVTIVSFSDNAKIIQASNQAAGNNSYFGIHGFFTLQPGLKVRTTVFIAPYRFDDVVQGQSIRQWIYQLHQNQMLPPAIN